MAVLTVSSVDRDGLDHLAALVAADAGGDEWVNTGKEFLLVVNDHATISRTVTLDIVRTVDGQSVTDRTVVIPALESKLIGPFPTSDYNAAGNAKISYDDSADVTVGVFKIADN